MALNEKVDIEIRRRRFTIEMEGFTPMEIAALAQQVEEKIQEAENENPKVADTSKLAIMAALKFAGALSKTQSAADTSTRVLEHKVEELTLALQSALAPSK